MAKKQYADMSKDELKNEMNKENAGLDLLAGSKLFGYYIGAPLYAAVGIYNALGEDAMKSVKYFVGAAVLLGLSKLCGIVKKNAERKITEIKSVMGSLETKVEE